MFRLGLFAILFAVSAYAADVNVGWLKTYSHPLFAISIRAPIPDEKSPGTLADINAWPATSRLPERFLIGDGSVRRAVLLVDQSSGSELDLRLSKAAAQLTERTALETLRARLPRLLQADWSLGEDETGDNPWDPPAPEDSALEREQAKHLAALGVGGSAVATDRRLPIVRLEKFLEQPSSAYCIEKALFARLLLERLGIASRYVAGAKLAFKPGEKVPRNLGHSWVALDDNRILDPTDHVLQARGKAHPDSADWFEFHGEYRFEDQYYPIVILE